MALAIVGFLFELRRRGAVNRLAIAAGFAVAGLALLGSDRSRARHRPCRRGHDAAVADLQTSKDSRRRRRRLRVDGPSRPRVRG